MTAFSTADASGQFVASVIVKKARNEVQIRVFPGENGLVSDELVQRFDLDALAKITSVSWFNDVVGPKKKSKKRQNDSNGVSEKETASGPQGLLAVVLDSSEVWVLSPYSETPLHKITELKKVLAVAGSRKPGAFWAHSPGSLIEYSISSQSISTFIKVPKSSYTCIQHLESPNAVALGGLAVHLADPAKKAFSGKISTDGIVSAFQQAALYLYVAVEGSSDVNVYDLSRNNELVGTLECAGEVAKISKIGDSQVAIICSHTTQIYSGTELISTIHGSVENFFSQKSAYVAVLYDRNQPEFVVIPELQTDLHIQTKQKQQKTKKEASPDITLDSSRAVEIDNLPPLELYSGLSALLGSKKVLKSKVIRLCSSNDDEENIKETFRLFSQSDDREVLVKNLFSIVSTKVASDPLSKSLLSLWLKWILLTHGGYILKQELLRDNLKKLQRSFEDGMTMMLRLLALQGRLQLLKSHAEFRNQVAEAEVPESESEDESEAEDDAAESNVEELIVYANGENDDFDSADNVEESLGEDESEEEFVSFDEE